MGNVELSLGNLVDRKDLLKRMVSLVQAKESTGSFWVIVGALTYVMFSVCALLTSCQYPRRLSGPNCVGKTTLLQMACATAHDEARKRVSASELPTAEYLYARRDGVAALMQNSAVGIIFIKVGSEEVSEDEARSAFNKLLISALNFTLPSEGECRCLPTPRCLGQAERLLSCYCRKKSFIGRAGGSGSGGEGFQRKARAAARGRV